MPYYCTVPQCTSMAGKAKNVSFHQFPRDEELANMWNNILKRGKPYTKYSKVCSLHFRAEDYTMTSMGKNKGQWRTLRKDAVPSMNLPSKCPPPYNGRRSSVGASQTFPTNLMDPQVQQQMAQAIYVQTMLAMQAAGFTDGDQAGIDLSVRHDESSSTAEEQQGGSPARAHSSHADVEDERTGVDQPADQQGTPDTFQSYRCEDCTKCFKDPDVFLLHKRTHTQPDRQTDNLTHTQPDRQTDNLIEKLRQETLNSNPILANLLKPVTKAPESANLQNNLLGMENQLMTAMALNMEAYIRNVSSMMAQKTNFDGSESDASLELNESKDRLVIDETA